MWAIQGLMEREESVEQLDWLNWFPIELYKCYLAGGCVMIRTSKGEILNTAQGVNIPSCSHPSLPHADFGDQPAPAGTSAVTCPTLKFAAPAIGMFQLWVTLLWSLLQVPCAVNSLQPQLGGQRKKTLMHCCSSELQVMLGKRKDFHQAPQCFGI